MFSSKKPIEEDDVVRLNDRCSTALQNQPPPKENDLGRFTLLCFIGSLNVRSALADLGASINFSKETHEEELELLLASNPQSSFMKMKAQSCIVNTNKESDPFIQQLNPLPRISQTSNSSTKIGKKKGEITYPLSREIFNKWQAERWWSENCEKIMEVYNVQRFNQQGVPLLSTSRSEDAERLMGDETDDGISFPSSYEGDARSYGSSHLNIAAKDDFFLFARGHPTSVSVIMDALDEFKQVSGLVPSIPKSTAFFCNVPNAIKASILNSMQLRKASVFILPTRIVHDLEQLMRGFLWCQGEIKKAMAKVAWDSVCLPKLKGGLGIRRIDEFNVALMATHIWCILTHKESLWVKWMHTYKLKGRSFWDVPCRGDVSWGW
ncbi:sodium/hydrogen exchanger 6 [Tanacetum coccineum]